MRPSHLLFIFAMVAGCGDSTPAEDLSVPADMATPDLAMPDLKMVGPDMAQPPVCATKVDRGDAGASQIFMCGVGSCADDEFCCVTGATGGNPSGACNKCCSGGTLPVQCRNPDDCNGNPCCITINGTTPHDVSCTASKTACVPMAGLTNTSTRGCRSDADCTSGPVTTTLNQCCTLMGQKACLNTQIAGLIGASCP